MRQSCPQLEISRYWSHVQGSNLLILEKAVRLDQPKEMSAATAQANMELISHGETDVLLVDGVNIMRELRTLRVEETVSHVSKVSGVRKALINQQRIIARQGPIVIVGRDVGTVVLQNAPVKVYLDAPPDVRAFRRYTERLSDKENSTLEKVKLEIGNRDRIDSGRKESPLYPAKDAIVIDTSSLTINDVVRKILEMTKL